MPRFALLLTALLACTPGTPSGDAPASEVAADRVAFHFAWPEGRAVVTQTRRLTGAGGENSTLTTRWTLTVARVGDELVLESSDYEVVAFEGSVGRFQIVDARGVLGELRVDAHSGEIVEIGGFDALGEHVRAMERARHPDQNDEGHEFRGRVIETLAGPEQLRVAVRSSWAVLVGNLEEQPLAFDGEGTLRSNKTLAYGGGVVVDTLVERSVKPDVACGDAGPRTCVRVRTHTRVADPVAAAASVVRAMDEAAGDAAASSELGNAQVVGEWDTELVCDPSTLRPYTWVMRDRTGIANGGELTVNDSEVSLTLDWG